MSLETVKNVATLGIAGAFAVAGGGLVVASGIYVAQSDEKVEFVVDEKVVKSGNKSSKYLIFTEGEVFENTDSWSRWKWNSSDIQNAMKEGCKYEATVFGYRSNFLSTYRDIVDVKHIPTENCPTPKGPVAK